VVFSSTDPSTRQDYGATVVCAIKSKGSAEDELYYSALKFCKNTPDARGNVFMRAYGQPSWLPHTLQARINALQRTAGTLLNRRRYSPSNQFESRHPVKFRADLGMSGLRFVEQSPLLSQEI